MCGRGETRNHGQKLSQSPAPGSGFIAWHTQHEKSGQSPWRAEFDAHIPQCRARSCSIKRLRLTSGRLRPFGRVSSTRSGEP
eukprot:7377188-Prymnesium_polylepis.4